MAAFILLTLGVGEALAQETTRAVQTVSFAVSVRPSAPLAESGTVTVMAQDRHEQSVEAFLIRPLPTESSSLTREGTLTQLPDALASSRRILITISD